MLKKWIVFVLLAVLAAGCTAARPNALFGSGTAVTKDFQVVDFDRVDAAYGFRVTLARGEPFKVTVTTHDNIMQYVRVEKAGDTLKLFVDMRPFTTYTINRLEATVTMPALAGVTASGGSRVDVAGFDLQPALEVDLSGGSRLTGDLSAAKMRLQTSGGSSATVAGKADSLNLEASGGGRTDLSRLEVTAATVRLSGGSTVIVNAGELSYDLSGGSQLRYTGNPRIVSQNTSGGASAVPVNP
jgi:hypothetical protein